MPSRGSSMRCEPVKDADFATAREALRRERYGIEDADVALAVGVSAAITAAVVTAAVVTAAVVTAAALAFIGRWVVGWWILCRWIGRSIFGRWDIGHLVRRLLFRIGTSRVAVAVQTLTGPVDGEDGVLHGGAVGVGDYPGSDVDAALTVRGTA